MRGAVAALLGAAGFPPFAGGTEANPWQDFCSFCLSGLDKASPAGCPSPPGNPPFVTTP
jgi:hypothetical protein